MDIVANAREAGVTVAGGEPLHPLLERPVQTVLAGCVESEPLSAAARALVATHPAAVLEGLTLAMKATRARFGVFAVPSDEPGLHAALEAVARDFAHLRIEKVLPFHPLGTPRVLARELLGVTVPADTSLGAAGVLVLDVQALYHLAGACDGRPVTHRFVTVAGEVEKPATMRVPIGTPLGDLVRLCGGVTGGVDAAIVVGGVLAGRLAGFEDTVGRDDSAVSVLPAAHPAVERVGQRTDSMVARARSVCGGCRLCTESCPQHLAGHAIQPHLLMRAMAHGLSTIDDVVLGAGSCTGCLVCRVACPAGLAPGRVYATVRAHLLEKGLEQVPVGPLVPAHEAERERRMTRRRLAERLGVVRYDGVLPVDDNYHVVPRVQLGADFGVPRVTIGERVEMGRLLVDAAEGGLPVHAPIPGVVSRVVGPSARGYEGAPMAGSSGRVARGVPAPNGMVEIRSR